MGDTPGTILGVLGSDNQVTGHEATPLVEPLYAKSNGAGGCTLTPGTYGNWPPVAGENPAGVAASRMSFYDDADDDKLVVQLTSGVECAAYHHAVNREPAQMTDPGGITGWPLIVVDPSGNLVLSEATPCATRRRRRRRRRCRNRRRRRRRRRRRHRPAP